MIIIIITIIMIMIIIRKITIMIMIIIRKITIMIMIMIIIRMKRFPFPHILAPRFLRFHGWLR